MWMMGGTFLGYMLNQKSHRIILFKHRYVKDGGFVGKPAAFTLSIQGFDYNSLSLVMRDTKYNGSYSKRALFVKK